MRRVVAFSFVVRRGRGACSLQLSSLIGVTPDRNEKEVQRKEKTRYSERPRRERIRMCTSFTTLARAPWLSAEPPSIEVHRQDVCHLRRTQNSQRSSSAQTNWQVVQPYQKVEKWSRVNRQRASSRQKDHFAKHSDAPPRASGNHDFDTIVCRHHVELA